MMKNKKKKRLIIIFSSIIGFIVLLVGVFFIYTAVYYHAEDIGDSMEDTLLVDVEDNDGYYSFNSRISTNNVIIFYPGGKVDEASYAPLAKGLATLGNHVYILKVPFHLAFFNMNGPSSIIEMEKKNNPNAKIYLMGHSLGGATMGLYAYNNSDNINGCIFLAAYTTKNLGEKNIKCLSIYGSNDQVLNKDSYNKNHSNFPTNVTEYIINGGNHGYFGNYGEQSGDGVATISRSEQQTLTIAAIEAFMAF